MTNIAEFDDESGKFEAKTSFYVLGEKQKINKKHFD